jgi:DNA invertase Pin-like site-specific DNA recombinase
MGERCPPAYGAYGSGKGACVRRQWGCPARRSRQRSSCIFARHLTQTSSERPGLQEALNHLRAGDTLVVWRLDRLGRTLKHLIATISDLSERGIGFKSLQENMATTTSGGKLIFHIFGALAEFEREVIRERTNAGLQAARARGRLGGRPTIQSRDPKKVALAKQFYADGHMPVKEIGETLHIGRSTLYRYLQS